MSVDETVSDSVPKMDTSNVPNILAVGEIDTFDQLLVAQ